MKILGIIATVSLALGFLGTANDVNGAPVTEPLTVTIAGGPFDGVVGTGSFSYDDALVIVGDETLDIFTSLEIDFTIFGQMFTEADDIDFDSFPTLTFESFVPSVMDYVISEFGFNPVEIDEPDVESIGFGILFPASGGGFEADGFVDLVPEPSTLLLGALATVGLLTRRRVSS